MENTDIPEDEFRQPEPGYGRKLFTGYTVGLAILFALPYWGWTPLKHWILSQTPLAQVLIAEVLAITFLVAFIPSSLFIIRTGKRIVAEDAYPHSGMRILYPTRIQRGKMATRRGKALVWLGQFAIFAVILASLSIHFICYKFLTDPFFFVR